MRKRVTPTPSPAGKVPAPALRPAEDRKGDISGVGLGLGERGEMERRNALRLLRPTALTAMGY